ncbi:YkgJ family cysteine cluster protein [Nonomuraea sp. NPDC049758]|uniref:YkgJ family cysteine cluster protein n=1 Tax=Nonomuraea sp. NPDC049758 TaxID=3154360 RepID=UPI00341EA7A5
MDARLADLYAQVPQPNCKGLCADSCGPIDMNARERQRIRARGVTIPHHDDQLDQAAREGDYTCPALKDERCSVYADRPMICRLWGAAEAMACPHGCRPEGGLLSDGHGSMLLYESLALGAADADVIEQRRRQLQQRFADAEFRRAYREFVRRPTRLPSTQRQGGQAASG